MADSRSSATRWRRFSPGKLIFAAVPYVCGARLYLVGHVALAFLGMIVLARWLNVSWTGAGLSGLSYAFGAPVLFQYCNVIFLVGAAWVPWGLCATDRLVRLRRPSGVWALALVLALEVLGGDPQAAYLTVITGAGLVLLVARQAHAGQSLGADRPRHLRPVLALAALAAVWIVHRARVVPPAADAETRARLFGDLAFQNDAFWHDPRRPIFDPRAMALIETNDPDALRGYLTPQPVAADESVRITRRDPQRVELGARLRHAGIVILADTHDPGWRLTIDGRPSPILRTNRLMRGAAVAAGEHTLVYRYDPWSFRFGAAVTLVGLTMLLVLIAWSGWRHVMQVPTADPAPGD